MMSIAHATLHAHLQIVLMPLRQRRNEGHVLSWLLTALGFMLPTLLIAWWQPQRVATVALVSLAVALQVLWITQFASLRRQNHPISARLVPGHLLRLREQLVASFLLLAGLSGLLLGLRFGHTLAWTLGAGVLMLATATMSRWPLLWALFGLMPLNVFLPSSWAPLAWLRQLAVEAYLRQPLLLAMAALLLLPWLLCLHLESGGSAHFRSYARGERWRQAMRQASQGGSLTRYQGPISQWFAQKFSWPYRAWMQHLLAVAVPTERSVLARAELVLGASTHWTAQLATLLIFGLCFALSLLVAYFGFGVEAWDLRAKAGTGLSIGAMSAAISPVLARRVALHASRREQALLMLVPGMPRGAVLNQRLARRQMLHFCGAWLGGALLLFCATVDTRVAGPALGFALACLPSGLLLWRDWSRLPQPGGSSQSLPVLLLLGAGGAMAALMQWVRPSPWLVVLLVLGFSLALGTGLWRRLARYPQAFPVGRLAR